MRTFFSAKRSATVATVATATVLAGGVAFAYWTVSGSGTGSAVAGSTQAITINQSSTVTGLYPGGPAADLAGTFSNPNAGKVFVSQVTVAVDPAFSSAKVNPAGTACTASDFTVTQPAATNAEILPGTVSTWSGATVSLKDTAGNQDNCKGVTVPLVYSSN